MKDPTIMYPKNCRKNINRIVNAIGASVETTYAMKEADDWDEDDSRSGRSSYGRGGDRSYRRGRDSMGRYTSRDMGYSGGYPEWMPPMYPRY